MTEVMARDVNETTGGGDTAPTEPRVIAEARVRLRHLLERGVAARRWDERSEDEVEPAAPARARPQREGRAGKTPAWQAHGHFMLTLFFLMQFILS